MFAFGESFFRASRFNRNVCHFNVFANVFFGACFIRIGAGFIRAGFIARDESARQNECHCQNGKNKKDSFFVGFHNKPRNHYYGASKISKKYNKCIPADSATNLHTTPSAKTM